MLLPYPHVARREGSSQRLFYSGLAFTQVMVPPLQKAGDTQESTLTGEARHPHGERSCHCAGTPCKSPKACGARVAPGWGPLWWTLTDP